MGANYNVSMNVGGQVFYVRPFTDDLKMDLDRLMMDASKVSSNVTITEKNGTYAIATTECITAKTFAESFWGMLLRRFMAESKQVCIDPKNEEKYYVLMFSMQFIAPCARQLAA